ncbi:hypothetical protein OCH239_12355 [Roseivivax halodurans JCM 10272]|uniref:Uncharacterized protein n=1 Tax=Roseivivax halodurans JCM 10272 TaxID=1449350 RepID=X7EDU1_9RHOB|nr:hypothetical protein [Roseivivax halodurans]ETX13293.1 hypothetical protein OCH239_12355 [Roseivivax halodurans JCM 10272]
MPFESEVGLEAELCRVAGRDDADTQDELWLLGQPTLADFLDHVRKAVDGGDRLDRRLLVDAWREANDHYAELETTEAGIADEIDCLELPAELASLAEDLSEREHFRNTFDRMPTTFGMVELDKIVVSQRRVTLPFVEALAAKLDPRPDPKDLFRFCQPFERRDPPVEIMRLGNQRFVFSSDSNDLRFHETAMLRADQVTGRESFAPVSGAVGLFVGYGSNFLTLIRSEDRMVLHNGYHRAVAMRMAGVTHVPCVIQTVTRRDELEVSAAQPVVDDPTFYFRSPRPPILKDFFDPAIRTLLRTRRTKKLVEVSFEVRDYTVYEGGA